MPDLKWYIRRARAMSGEEIAHRFRMELHKSNWRKLINENKLNEPVTIHWQALPKETAIQVDEALKTSEEAARLLEEAQAYLEHRWFYGGISNIREEVIDWHRDPASAIIAPRIFGFDINHRDETLVGNIKFTWEKSRHHHLTVLAAAYALTQDERYSAEIAHQILEWVDQNPYMVGVNWTHPLEQAIRLIAWIWCERLLRSSEHYERVFGQSSPIWLSIHQHQRFIEQTYSRGSSANNHLIGEMAGLFIAATVWPIFDDSKRWQELSHRILEREIINQTFASGINREMAFSYHIFALEFFLLAYAEAQQTGFRFSDQYTTLLKKTIEVMPLLTDYDQNLPRYGDGDEGMALQLQSRQERRDSWLLRAGKSLLGAQVDVSAHYGILAAALLGLDQTGADSKNILPDGSTAFEDAGVYLLTSKRNTPQEVFILADAGPHGYLSITAHAHADALSFTLSAGGKPILIDPGTYAYHTDHQWRSYFRGTRAHNTLMIDGLDQSTQQGAFLWTQKAETRVLHWKASPEGGELLAAHDGYQRFGVTHQRRLQLQGNHVTVEDALQGEGTHDVLICYHTAPECHVEQLDATTVSIMRDHIKVHLKLPEKSSVELIRGGGPDSGGWYSPEFGVKQETTSIFARISVSLSISLRTELEINYES